MNGEMEWLVNGGIRIVSGPVAPENMPTSDGVVIEYLLSFPMYIVDSSDWKPIEYFVNGLLVSIERPVSISAPFRPENRFGNEAPEAFCSVVRVRAPFGELGHHEGWKIVERLLEWIRVKCRHYWLLHGSAGVGALYRGTIFSRHHRELRLQNMAVYAPGVVVRPLTESMWLSIREELVRNAEVPLADAIYCDALLSVAGRNEMKALLEAGVAAEVAITQLLTEVSSILPDSRSKSDFRNKRGDYSDFKTKLTEWPQRLGLESANDFTFPEMPTKWVQIVQELYQLRNGVAHGGKLKAAQPLKHVGHYIFAVNALLEYCRAQRTCAGCENYKMPPDTTSYDQTVKCHDAFLAADSQLLNCVLK